MDVPGAPRRRNERGDTLIEIIIALVILSGVVASFFAAYGTAATASSTHRDLVTADVVVRGYAEATKLAVRTDCSRNPGGNYRVSYSPPSGFAVSPRPGSNPCPPPEAPAHATLRVTLPNGQVRALELVLRTP